MSCWFETIISKLTPSTKKPIVALDSQKYLEISEIQERLKQEGYNLIFAKAGIQLRMKYELEAKGKEKTILAVEEKCTLLDDIKESAFVIELNPKEIFRNFDEKALCGLSYNALSIIDSIKTYKELSYEDTVIFLLENLYGVNFHFWQNNKSKEQCLAILICVYTNSEKPNVAINVFLENLAKPYFGDKIKDFTDKDKLLDFVNSLSSNEINLENPNLLKEISKLKGKCGGKNNFDFADKKKLKNHISELFNYFEKRLNTLSEQYKDWFEIAPKLGELGNAIYQLNDEKMSLKYYKIVSIFNDKFQIFIDNQYDSLFSLSGLRHPITIDKVQDYIAANTKNKKIAFIVIDGMNYWQWTILKNKLQTQNLNVEDKTTLSWIPSITAWARQAIFAGKKPDISIDNKTEGELFKKYWIEKHQKLPYQVTYEKIKTEQKIEIPSSDVTVAGFVTNGLDDLMHGNTLGNEQLFINTNLWIEKSDICNFIKNLHDAGFEIYISTDHGNIEAELNLKVSASKKTLMHSKSKRFVQFDTEEQAKLFIENNKNFQLGQKGKSVYFKDTNGFGTNSEKVITHGGSHIFELLIPVGVVR